MAVAYDNSAEVQGFSATSLTTGSFTISGSNRAACMALLWVDSISGISGSCGGASMTAVTSAAVTFATTIEMKMYSCIAPDTGSQTATSSWTTARNATLSVVTATGVDQTTPMNNGANVDDGFTTSSALEITSTNGDLTVTYNGCSQLDSAQTTDQTQRTTKWACMDTGPGTGTTTHTWSHDATNMATIGANFNAAAGGGATHPGWMSDGGWF